MSSGLKDALLTDAVGFRNCGTPEAQGFCPRIPCWRYSIGRFRCRVPAERRSPSGSGARLVTAVKSLVWGVYRVPMLPRGEHDDLAAAVAWSFGRGVVSHESAVQLHGLADVNPSR